MKPLLFAVVVLVLGLLVLAVIRKRDLLGVANDEWPFYAKRPLSPPEQVLYHRLVAALPEHIVLAQVQVSRVLGVKQGFNFHQWNNRINRLSYDFVVCSKDSKVLAAIELDDKSHEAADRVNADRKKGRATAAAGVRLIRWNVRALPDAAAIREAMVGTQHNPSVRQADAGVPKGAELDLDEPEWAGDYQPFGEPKDDKLILKIVAGAAVAVAIAAFVLRPTERDQPQAAIQAAQPVTSDAVRSDSRTNARAVIESPLPEIVAPASPAQQARKLMAAEQQAAEAAKRAALEATVRKEQAWANFYKRSAYCDNPNSEQLVQCANEFIRAKRQFEEAYATGKL